MVWSFGVGDFGTSRPFPETPQLRSFPLEFLGIGLDVGLVEGRSHRCKPVSWSGVAGWLVSCCFYKDKSSFALPETR